MSKSAYDVVIAGGGLAGLTSAILLAETGIRVLLIEKKNYPYHKVCGEYVSNEVRPFLQKLGIDFGALGVAEMNRLRISDTNGKNMYAGLDLGGFGISRYKLDHHLYELALEKGAEILTNTRIQGIVFGNNEFHIEINGKAPIAAKLVIGSYGKREMLDKSLDRSFVNKRTGYMAVKYHVQSDHPVNEIGLDNFKGGYCGISKIEEDRYCLCYLLKRKYMKPFKTIAAMEEEVLFKNPSLKELFMKSTFLYEKPEVINEISFAAKKPVENHILMCGDTAGLIAPLCGNGMSMAIHGAKLLCELIISSDLCRKSSIALTDRIELEQGYEKVWKKQFRQRLRIGRVIQGLLGNPFLTNTTLRLIGIFPALQNWLIRKTHGKYI